MRKKIISWCLIFVILFGMSSQLFITSEAIGSVSGECGDDLEWLLDLKTGILTISGQGKMWDWASVMSSLYADPVSTAPWNSYSNEIKQVIFPEGVTTIGDCAFLNCTNLSYINIPEGVTSIGMSAFESCCNLNEIIIPSTVTYISSGTFKCTALKEIVLPKKLTFLGAVAFYGCSDLRNVYFLGDAPNLGYNAFGECPEGLTIFYVHGKSGWSGTKWKNYSLATWEGDGEDNQTTEPTEKPTQKPTEAPTQQPTEEQRPTSPAIDMQSGSCGSKAKWSADGQKRVLTISGSGKMEDYSVVTLLTWYMYNYDLGEGKGIATIVIQEGIVSVGGCAFYGLSDVTSVSFPSTLKEIGPRQLPIRQYENY